MLGRVKPWRDEMESLYLTPPAHFEQARGDASRDRAVRRQFVHPKA